MRGTTSRIIFTEWLDKSGNPIIVLITIGENNRISVPDDAIKNIVNTAFGAEEAYLKSLENVKVLYPEIKKISVRFSQSHGRQVCRNPQAMIPLLQIYTKTKYLSTTLSETPTTSPTENCLPMPSWKLRRLLQRKKNSNSIKRRSMKSTNLRTI